MSEKVKGEFMRDDVKDGVENTADSPKHRFFAFYRNRRPEYFSDSEVRYEMPLTRELFELQLSHLSTNKKQAEFERFVVAIARRLITPNIKSQTGPDGGGDGKVDAETYEVSDDISDKWYADECGSHGKEKWAFTISCKSQWKEKIKSDVKKAVETGRGYTRVLCFSCRQIKADKRFELEESLSKTYHVDVKVYDYSWCRDAVFENGCLDVALAELGFSEDYKRREVRIGFRDEKRKQRLVEIERSILRKVDGLDTDYVDELTESCILSRGLGCPRHEVEGRFERALRECSRHGTESQMFNIIYDHAWTSLFWFEDCECAYADYQKLKPYVASDCSVARLEKLTNLLSIFNSAVRLKVTDLNLTLEYEFIKDIAEKVESDPKRQSCALFLKLQQAEQRLIAEAHDEKMLKQHLATLKPLMASASYNLEIGFETHYDIMRELSERFAGSRIFEDYLDGLAEIIAKHDSDAAAALVRLDRAQSHFDAGRWKDAIKQLGFCLYAFEQESRIEEIIHSSILMGLSLWAMRLPYSAEAYLVKAAFLLIKRLRSGGVVEHRLISVLSELCEIELLVGRLVMYLNWRNLLNMLAQNGGFSSEGAFVEQMHMQDACWACRFAASNLNDAVYTKLPDILDRHGLWLAADQLRFAFGHIDSLDAQDLTTLRELQGKFLEQPVFQQFLNDLDVAKAGRVTLQTTVRNFTFRIEYENGCAHQQLAEIVLASMESLLATNDADEVIPRNATIVLTLEETEGDTELKALCADDEYQLRVNGKEWSGEALWKSLANLIAHLFRRNAICRGDMHQLIEKKQEGERLFDRVSILQRSHIAMIGVLGETFRCKIEDWMEESDRIYEPKQNVKAPPQKEYLNQEQKNTDVYSVSKYSGAWDEAGWMGAFFCAKVVQPPIFALVFKEMAKIQPVIDEWGERIGRGERPIKIFIIRGICEAHPLWYRVGIVPGDVRTNTKEGRYIVTECKRHTLMPKTQAHLNAFEADFKRLGVCWLTACAGDEKFPDQIPRKFTKALRFTDIEFKEAWSIGNGDEACFALGPDDNPVIPEEHKGDAPVLALLESLHKLQMRFNAEDNG